MQQPKQNHHRHKCKHCNTIWQHHDDCSRLATTDREAYKQAHKCPNCKRPSLKKYQG